MQIEEVAHLQTRKKSPCNKLPILYQYHYLFRSDSQQFTSARRAPMSLGEPPHVRHTNPLHFLDKSPGQQLGHKTGQCPRRPKDGTFTTQLKQEQMKKKKKGKKTGRNDGRTHMSRGLSERDYRLQKICHNTTHNTRRHLHSLRAEARLSRASEQPKPTAYNNPNKFVPEAEDQQQ